MSNLESLNGKKVLFIAIPRTGSVSIIRYFDWRIRGHQDISHFINKQRDFTFTFVRNPYDRLLSAFLHLKNGGMNAVDKRDYNVYLSKYNGSFKRFVLEGLGSKDECINIFHQQHFKPQMWHVVDVKYFNYIGRFETYNNSFLALCNHLNATQRPLKIENKTQHAPWREYYNDEMKRIVSSVYELDFDILQYTPEI